MSRKAARLVFALVLSAIPAPVLADSVAGWQGQREMPAGELPPYIECVPYARETSGIRIYGDAHSWWDQAEGLYARGDQPRAGAVMALRPHGAMQLGHVATVSRVLDSRTVLLRHANWSPIDGQRGRIEEDVKAVDVSPRNDWSEVRIWYAPQGDLGTTRWPVAGFIYPQKAQKQPASARLAALAAPISRPSRAAPARDAIGAIIASF